jgi:hypothetical protein
MKSKISASYSVPMFIALAALLIAVPLRVYQYFNIIDSNTGFYNKTDFSVYIMYAVLGISIIAGILFPFINHSKRIPQTNSKRSPGFLAVSVVMAVGVIIDSAMQVMTYFDLYNADLTAGTQTVSEYVSSQGGTILLLQAIFGGLSAVYFFVTGLSVGVGGSDGAKYKIFALVPVIWCIFRLLYRFKRTISFINVSDLLIELFMIVFAMLFFLAYAQVTSKVDGASVYWKMFAYGIPAVLFALVCFLPRLIVTIVGKGSLLSTQYGMYYSDIAFAIFAIYNLISRAKTPAHTFAE